MERYTLTRSDSEVGRFTKTKDKHVYVFRDFGDHWAVHKLAIENIREAHEAGLTGNDLLAEPDYRIMDGACSCPGFGYRRECWHKDQVLER